MNIRGETMRTGLLFIAMLIFVTSVRDASAAPGKPMLIFLH